MSESNDTKIKVTDRRLFTPDGELREEYRDLESDETRPRQDEPVTERAAPAPDRTSAEPAATVATPAADSAAQASARGAAPPTEEGGPKPTLLDLIGVVAQPIALYLGDAKMPDGESVENLELARLYIDLLEVLQAKTEGNRSQQESAFLEDLLYQLRLRYVEKRKQRGGD